MNEAVIEAVTDKVTIAERRLAVVCIHCGEPFDDDYGWEHNATCNDCETSLPADILEDYIQYTSLYKHVIEIHKNEINCENDQSAQNDEN